VHLLRPCARRRCSASGRCVRASPLRRQLRSTTRRPKHVQRTQRPGLHHIALHAKSRQPDCGMRGGRGCVHFPMVRGRGPSSYRQATMQQLCEVVNVCKREDARCDAAGRGAEQSKAEGLASVVGELVVELVFAAGWSVAIIRFRVDPATPLDLTASGRPMKQRARLPLPSLQMHLVTDNSPPLDSMHRTLQPADVEKRPLDMLPHPHAPLVRSCPTRVLGLVVQRVLWCFTSYTAFCSTSDTYSQNVHVVMLRHCPLC
jgi:hypothetical protein